MELEKTLQSVNRSTNASHLAQQMTDVQTNAQPAAFTQTKLVSLLQ